MHDTSILDDLHSELDVSLCYTAAIHGFWSQIWAFRESWKFHAIGESRDSVHRLWLVTQQRELYRQVEAFEQNLLSTRLAQSEILIVAELLLMILHVSPEELQRFAGKSGVDAASQAFASLEIWWDTEHARRAVWHAGQVFRWASMFPPAELRDFYAVAVYFASLALWSFGHLSISKNSFNSSKNHNNRADLDDDGNGNFLVINSEEISGPRSFIAGRHSIPVLTHMTSKAGFDSTGTQHEKLVRLNNPNGVLQLARELYRNNFPMEGAPLPPLVENLGNLLRDLGGLPENRFSSCVSPL